MYFCIPLVRTLCINNINAHVYPGSDKTAPALIDPLGVLEVELNCAVRIEY